MEIFKEFAFEAAHRLTDVPNGHKCGRIHGHRYAVRVHIHRRLRADEDWLMDFSELSQACDPVLKQLDHHSLNDIPGLENPTCEVISRWIWRRLRAALPDLSQVVVQETGSSGCICRGEDEEAP